MIKRLREQSELLQGARESPAPEVGTEIGDFTARTVDGEPVSRASIAEETLVAFFSPDCRPCQEKLPLFVSHAATLPAGRVGALAVVVGFDGEESSSFVAQLRAVARVVTEGAAGPMAAAFGVRAFPTMLAVAPDHSGRLVVASGDLEVTQTVLAVG
ncbi:TlpA family protein disulfide reductase [Nonomuraea typhae]|uniref:TlpA family protein disulfide reductase n=1 Tax=Nonomuraea typhae TaxID=2603600 RepID=UPI0015E1C4AE|nr:redoxin domain-containing protein [Nonomuraea typhae]